MIIERVRTPGISHYSYLVGSGTAAAVIDPRRDTDEYLAIAEKNALSITHIFETHRNEDFVSGAPELAWLTGAKIFHGHSFPFQYGSPAREGDIFSLGSVTLTVLETPGHTLESISLVLRDTAVSDDPLMVFTGDTLFAGETGRTDFYGKEKLPGLSALLYDSIHQKILPLGIGVIIAPAHGAGSVCGAGIFDLPVTTTGYEMRNNPGLFLEKEEFIKKKKAENHYYPPYFRQMERLNTEGAPILKRLPVLKAFTPDALEGLMKGFQLLDIRMPTSFASGHVPGSLSIWRDGVAAFAGWFLDFSKPIILIGDTNEMPGEVVRQLVRIGYDTVPGYLAGGFAAWTRAAKSFGTFETWSVSQLHDEAGRSDLTVLDVRDITSRQRYGAIKGSLSLYVGEVLRDMDRIPRDRRVACICDAGYKGSLAASLLVRAGYSGVINVLGGMGAWTRAGFPTVPAGGNN